jgi:CRP-like cAMP-binding protein
VGDDDLLRVSDIAQFLAHSDIGNNLNLAQRTRLAAQCQARLYQPRQIIVKANEAGDELYVIQAGTVEVWSDREGVGGEIGDQRRVASFNPGQITGELAVLDQGLRSADLIAGPEGATLLALDREHLLALCEDDSVLGTRLLWNVATAMSQRVRFILWQLERARRRAAAREAQLARRR